MKLGCRQGAQPGDYLLQCIIGCEAVPHIRCVVLCKMLLLSNLQFLKSLGGLCSSLQGEIFGAGLTVSAPTTLGTASQSDMDVKDIGHLMSVSCLEEFGFADPQHQPAARHEPSMSVIAEEN